MATRFGRSRDLDREQGDNLCWLVGFCMGFLCVAGVGAMLEFENEMIAGGGCVGCIHERRWREIWRWLAGQNIEVRWLTWV